MFACEGLDKDIVYRWLFSRRDNFRLVSRRTMEQVFACSSKKEALAFTDLLRREGYKVWDVPDKKCESEQFSSILDLEKKLTDNGIPHEIEEFHDGWIIYYPDKRQKTGFAVETSYSLGGSQNLIEIDGFSIRRPGLIGHLTADEALGFFMV